ncbi:MAG: UDPglucose 6-dehydrogenase [Parcubacteria group bacterium Athens0714_26]|nr:MAG: UDPglucose 6-dehydrogenase [Parcubacteria group bacterium Athens1014_26]TSD01063.1 MAG: UDPglucose 6-dehydrogenase [Parcubacteria group bacterium Athens0714_26]
MGVGVVGNAVANVLSKPFLYDKYKKIGSLREINKADIIFICVPTPYDKKNGFDISFVDSAFRIIKGKKIIVIKSTVLPGTTEDFQKKFPQHKVLFNPEFLTEASAGRDMREPERQIVGYTEKSKDVADKVMAVLPRAPFEKIMPATEAEMVKYFGNTFLAIKVIFANQIYDFCQIMSLDYDLIKECVSADKRIGFSHLDVFHGSFRGYGGKCFPKDMKALIQFADKTGFDLRLHKIADEINDKMINNQKVLDPEKL